MKEIRRVRPEDPARLHSFREATQTLLWDEQHAIDSLSQLFYAIDDLAEAEVKYYYRRRTTRAWISGLSRGVAWVAGTIGVLLPLMASGVNSEANNFAQYGYVFIAIAASGLAANALFGGTEGHIRFFITQLELEKLMTKARISWCHYLQAITSNEEELEKGFLLIQEYAAELHTTTISETGRWGETLKKELAQYQKTLASKNNR